jgi:hypothetical protein
MPVWAWIVIAAVVALVILGAIAYYATRRRRTQGLQQRFGPEYDRTVAERGKRRDAEAELAKREQQREKIDIVPLSQRARDRYASYWRDVQTKFVDEPAGAVDEADRLVTEVMRERGYPIDDFEQRAADISVDHPEVVQHYRAAHAVYVKKSDGAGTEELRQGFVHYRELFEDLLETREQEKVRS